MKKTILCIFVSVGLTACNVSVSHDSTTTEETTNTPAATQSDLPAEPTVAEIAVNVPEKGADWIDHKMKVKGTNLILSAPKGIDVQSDDYAIYVRLDENHSMNIDFEAIDVPETKARYMGKSNRKDLQWLIDTETEALYTGLDLSAPEGHQTTNSFFATKKISNKDYSTNVDGITVDGDQTYNLSPENCQLLLGIFRTLRAK